MVADKQLANLVGQMKKAVGANLQSVILYGSAASGEFDPEYSNLNLLCILRETAFSSLRALAPAVEAWSRNARSAPLVITWDELQRSADVFSIELLDMKQNYRVLYGEDLLQHLQVPMRLHRAQLEYELREKLILLRERILLSGGKRQRLQELLLRSVPSFLTLFRHALLALGEPVPGNKSEVVERLSEKAGFDPAVFEQLLHVRKRKTGADSMQVEEVLGKYLAALERVVLTVDRLLDSA